MARPAKNSCDYFPHDNGMRNHVKIKAIRHKFEKGYSIWVMFLEFLTGADGNVFEYSDLQFELLSGDFGVSATEIKDVIDYALKLELVFNDSGFIYSESLNERLAPVYQKRGKSKDKSSRQKRINGQFAANNTDGTVVSVAETPQSKVKESKVNKIETNTEKFNFSKSLSSLDIDELILNDWLKVRKLKKCANTETAFNRIKTQVGLTTLTANECIKIAVEKSWGGFEAEWINNIKNNKNENNKRDLSQIDHGTARKLADM